MPLVGLPRVPSGGVNLNDYEYQFGDSGVILNPDDMTLPFLDVSKVTGLDGGAVRQSIRDRENIDGAYVDASRMAMRTIVAEGILYDDPYNPESLIDDLRENYGPSDSDQFFYFKHPGKSVRFCYGKGGGFKYDIDNLRRLGQTAFQATVLCSIPYIFDAVPTISTSGYTYFNPEDEVLNGNPTFETDILGWNAVNGATLAQSGTQQYAGSYSMQINGNGTVANPSAETDRVAIDPGAFFWDRAWFDCATAWAPGARVQLNWYTALVGGSLISSTNAATVALSAGTWTSTLVRGQAPATAQAVTMSAVILGTPAAGTAFFVDEAYLFAGPALGFPFGFPIGFTNSTVPEPAGSGGAQVHNNGSHVAYPILTVTGPITDPLIIDTAHGINMQFSTTLDVGDVLVIDCYNKTVTLNESVSRRQDLQGIQWAYVDKRADNTFMLFGTSTGEPTLSATLYSTYY